MLAAISFNISLPKSSVWLVKKSTMLVVLMSLQFYSLWEKKTTTFEFRGRKKIKDKLIKPNSHFPKKICFICFDESPENENKKWWKNYFILKTHSPLKLFKFLSWLFDHLEKTTWLERRLILKFMTSQPA